MSALAEVVVREYEGHHGFDNGNGAGQDAGVVATAAFEGGGIAVNVNRLLFGQNRGRGFESRADDDGFAVGDAALNPTRMVGARVNPVAVVVKRIVVRRAGHGEAGKARTGFKALARGQREHGFCQVRFEFVKDRLAPAGGNAMGDSFDDAAEGIALFAGRVNALNDLLGNLGVGHAGDVGLHLLAGDGDGVDVGNEGVNLADIGDDVDVAIAFEQFARNCPGCNPANGFARAGSAAALPVANAVFFLIRVIRVRGAVFGPHFSVVFGTRVLVPHHHRDGRAQGLAFKNTRMDFHAVIFFALRSDFALARLAAVEFKLNVFLAEFQPGRASIQHHANPTAVRLSPSGDAKCATISAAHNWLLEMICGYGNVPHEQKRVKQGERWKCWVQLAIARSKASSV